LVKPKKQPSPLLDLFTALKTKPNLYEQRAIEEKQHQEE
jgi:hypothetical protein